MKRSKIKVLHLITELPIGGAQDNTLLSVKGLKKMGYQVDLAAAPGGELDALAREYVDNLYYIEGFATNSISPAKNFQAILEVKKLLSKNKYDIIHTHSSTAGICGRIAAKLKRVPIIIHTVHGFPFHDFMKPIKKNFLIQLEKYCASLCDHMITVSNLNIDEIVERKISTRDKLTTVYSGIDLDKFNIDATKEEIKASLNIPQEDLVVGLIARMSNQKAPEYFIEAAKLILKEKQNVTFLMVGDGPLKDKLIEQIGDESKIRMLGSRTDIPEILKTLDIFALSSIYEGLGRAMTEAMICKKPIVAPNVNGIPEVVIDGETGFLIEPRDSKGLAEKIMLLLNDEDLRIKIGQNAHHKVVPAFSDKKMVEDIDKLYCKILKEKLNITVLEDEKQTVNV